MKTIINTEGMHCSGCENRTVAALKQLEGVSSVKANAKTGKVVIKHKDSETIEEAKALIKEIGYEVLS